MKFALVSGFAACLVLSILPVASADEDGPWAPSWRDILQDSYQLGHAEFKVGSRVTELTWDGLELGDNASQVVRGLVDGVIDGDEDGEVSEEEAETAEDVLQRLSERAFHQGTHDETASRVVLMDEDARVTDVRVTNLEATGVIGPIDSDEHVEVSFSVAFFFDTQAADVHTIEVNVGNFHVSDEKIEKTEELLRDLTVTIAPAKGWSIDPESIQPDCVAEHYQEETGTIEFSADDAECFQERGGQLIAFSITGHDEGDVSFVPGFEALLAGLGLVGAFLLGRRRA